MENELEKIIKIALDEDFALQDATSDLTLEDDYEIEFEINAREEMVLCGADSAEICFKILKQNSKFENSAIEFEALHKDGDFLQKGETIIKGKGNAKLIFAAERVILNMLQHLSGVSSLTKKFKDELDDEKIDILDTRKTTLGLRNLEKYAVLMGKGKNHRFNLSDMILIKDNHIAACGGISETIKKVKLKNNDLKIEIECDTIEQVKKVVESKVDVIMLDNMEIFEIQEAIKIINKSAKIEVSGGIDLKNINKYKGLDIDYISVGAITHSAKNVDIGLDVKKIAQ